jgi:hypothetical protein
VAGLFAEDDEVGGEKPPRLPKAPPLLAEDVCVGDCAGLGSKKLPPLSLPNAPPLLDDCDCLGLCIDALPRLANGSAAAGRAGFGEKLSPSKASSNPLGATDDALKGEGTLPNGLLAGLCGGGCGFGAVA